MDSIIKTVLVFLLLISTSFSTKKNAIKSIVIKSYSIAKNGLDFEADFSAKKKICFDRKGRKTEEYEFSLIDSIFYKISSSVYNVNNETNLLEVNNFKYSKDGKKYLSERLLKLLDKKNNTIELCNFFPDGTISKKTLYQYDNRENVIEEKYYIKEELSEQVIYHRNYKKKQFEVRRYKLESIISKDVKKTDSHGNILSLFQFSYDTLKSKSFYKYDNKKRLIELESFYPNDSIGLKCNWVYDNYGNQIEFTGYYPKNKPTHLRYKYIYKYDISGNWIQKYTFKNDSIKEKEIREIEYYNN